MTDKTETKDQKWERENAEKITALAEHLSIAEDDITASEYVSSILTAGAQEWIVLNNEEANVNWETQLRNRLVDVHGEIPEHLRFYFDDELWKRDQRNDGRGHCMNYYDGEEHHVRINETGYYLYRHH